MSSNNINDLLGADLDEEIDEILEDDDIDALLGPSGTPNTNEAILGGIGDEYLSDEEKVFLQNKDFLANTPPGELDGHFLQLQEELYSELENTLEDFSLGSVSDDDEFGEDPDDDDFVALEAQLDELEFGGHDESHIEGSAAMGFDLSPISPRLSRRQRRKLLRQRRRNERMRQAKLHRDISRNSASIRKEGRVARRTYRRDVRKGRKELRRTNRKLRSEAIIATRRRYIRLAKQLEKSCKGFPADWKESQPQKSYRSFSCAPHVGKTPLHHNAEDGYRPLYPFLWAPGW